jgi:hypothetical protein
MEKERITHESHDKDAWICICGNQPTLQGFYSCNKEGVPVEPDERWTTNWYVCDRCGRIIDQATLAVVGRNKEISDRYAVKGACQ